MDADAIRIRSGECWIHLAFDAASAIDLERAEESLSALHSAPAASESLGTHAVAGPASGASASRESISDSKRTPPGIQFRPKPLRLVRPTKALPIERIGLSTEPEVELTLYDFGAISVAYRVTVRDAVLDELRRLTCELADASPIVRAARAQVNRLLGELGDAAKRALVADPIEDYLVLHIRSWENGAALAPGAGSGMGVAPAPGAGSGMSVAPAPSAPTVSGAAPERVPPLAPLAPALAQVLRAADEPLSEAEVDDAMACTISYGRRDLAIIDWNAAILFEPDERSAADLLAVLEFANVELVELRFLDDRLDGILDRAYRSLWTGEDGASVHRGGLTRLWRRGVDREHRRLAALQMDSALLFEGVNNAIKLLGDQYLARVYRLAAKRFHLAEWDAAILRKLETLQQLYEKASDARSTRRMEVLEWIIIILIAISILLVFVPGTK